MCARVRAFSYSHSLPGYDDAQFEASVDVHVDGHNLSVGAEQVFRLAMFQPQQNRLGQVLHLQRLDADRFA